MTGSWFAAMATLRDRWRDLPRWQRRSALAGVVVVLYATLGFAVVPAVLERKLPEILKETLGRPVSVESIHLNPFLLRLSVRGLDIAEADGGEFFHLGELFVDVQTSSLLRRALTLRELRVTAPKAHVRILPDGKPAFADILERLASKPEDAQPEPVEESQPFPLIVREARLVRGKIWFRDEARPTPFEEAIGPLDLLVRDFTTRPPRTDGDAADAPYSFSTTTDTGATLTWEGTLSIAPLRSSGSIRLENFRSRTPWRYLRDDLLFEIASGFASLAASYDFDASGDSPQLLVRDGTISLEGITFFEEGVPASPLLRIPSAKVSGASIDLRARQVRIPRIESRGLSLRSRRDKDGSLHVVRLIPGIGESGAADDEGAAVEKPSSPPWTVTVDAIELTDYAVDFQDLSTPTPAKIGVGPISLALHDFSTAAGSPASVDLDIGIENGGRVGVTGSVALAPSLAADLEVAVDGFSLPLIQPYVAAGSGAVIAAGKLGADLEVTHRTGGDGASDTKAAGTVRVSGLDLGNRSGDDVLRFESLDIQGIRAAIAPVDVSIESVALAKPEATVHLRADGSTNLAELSSPQSDPEPETGTAQESEGTSDRAGPAEEPPAFRIERVAISDGAVHVRDESVTPEFKLEVGDLESTIAGISLDPSARLLLDVDAKLNRTAGLLVDGELAPRADPVEGQVKVQVIGLDTAGFSPYSGRYIAQHIARGKLFLDLDYKIENGELEASNGVRLETFNLGKRVQSPHAVDLPVALAIALLKDVRGRIKLDVPVSGRLDDPQFSLTGVIVTTFRDLILKAAASPFTLLGALVVGGGEEDLGRVFFEPGRYRLSSKEKDKLGQLARALEERPALRLEIPGGADPDLDTQGLREAALDDEMKALRFEEVRGKSKAPASAAEIELDDDLREHLSEELYESRFDSSLRKLRSEAPETDASGEEVNARHWAKAEMRRRLLASIEVEEADLLRLASARADAIVRHLIDSAGVAPQRATATAASLQAGGGAGEPYVELVLTAD